MVLAGQHSGTQFIQVSDCFYNDEVRLRFVQRLRLRGKLFVRLIEGGIAKRLYQQAERTHRSGYQCPVTNGFTGHANGGDVHVSHQVLHAVVRQPAWGGAEGVGFNNMGAGVHVGPVYSGNCVGVAQDP